MTRLTRIPYPSCCALQTMVLLLLWSLGVQHPLWAQKGVRGGFEVGLRVGPSFNFVTGVLPKADDFRRAQIGIQPRFHAGISVGYLWKRNIGLETGLYFQQQAFGIRSQASLDSFGIRKVDQELDYTLNYLQVPFFFRYNLPLGKQLVFQFAAGPRIGFLLGASRERRFAMADTARAYGLSEGREDQYQAVEFLDVAIAASGGVYYALSDAWYVGGGLRVEYSFTRIFSEVIVNNVQRISGGGNMANLHLQGGVYYRF